MEDNSKLMQQEIENKKKLPKEVKDKINTNIFKNLIAAVIVMCYLLLINFTYYKSGNSIENFMKCYSCIAAIISVVLFEIAYNKNSRFFCLVGIELLCLRCNINIYTIHILTYIFNFKKSIYAIAGNISSILFNKNDNNF